MTVISRRGVLAGSAALFGLAAVGLDTRSAMAAAAVRAPAVRAGYRFLDTAMDVHFPAYGEIRLPQSYTDEAGFYGSAYTADGALAGLAYLAEGSDASIARAKTIGDAFRYAQEHDPAYRDGRVRESYTVGPYDRNGVVQANGFVQPDGLVNAGNVFDHSGSTTGDQALAGLALLALARRGLGAGYGTAAVALGEWVVANCSTDGATGGFRAGIDRAGNVLTRTETGQNAVLAAFFGQLGAFTGAKVWTERRTKAAAFVAAMWQGTYYAYGTFDGVLPAAFPVTTEAQTAPVLALRGTAQKASLDYVTSSLTTTDSPASPNSTLTAGQSATGVTYSDWSRQADPDQPIEPSLSLPDPDAVWLAGSAQLAAALLARGAAGDRSTAFVQLNRLVDVQARFVGGKTAGAKPAAVGEGLIAASGPLHTGVTESGYYPYRHVGTTAWFLLAATGRNPYALDRKVGV